MEALNKTIMDVHSTQISETPAMILGQTLQSQGEDEADHVTCIYFQFFQLFLGFDDDCMNLALNIMN